ncbi:MAG TPA: hypothetical protein VIX73_02010, partial [Kofleriaceae bacterium]
PARLRRDPILADYRRVHAALAAVQKLRDRLTRLTGLAGLAERFGGAHPATGGNGAATAAPAGPTNGSVGVATIARGFAWMFSGAKLPAPRLLDILLGTGD